MATIETLPPESEVHADDHHGHDHPAWLAHHFDTPEQQFDSGKLGIWLFLVTEVLFFSGMFCAYAIFRMLRPDVFEGSSQFLNTKLGAINTGVLLFSSLTMAWAVRCSQTEEHKKLVALIATTLSCAMVFLGVKSIEYSHKWGMGLLPPGSYFYNESNPHPTADQIVSMGFSESAAYFLTHSLTFLCFPFAIATIGVLAWLLIAQLTGKKFQRAVAMPLSVVCLSFFLGVGLGTVLESGEAAHHEDAHAVAGDHSGSGPDGHDHEGHDESSESPGSKVAKSPSLSTNTGIELLAQQDINTAAKSMVAAEVAQSDLARGKVLTDASMSDPGIESVAKNVETPKQAGVFFGIYYCMTGIHAIHILGGIAVLIWLLVRAVRNDFNRQYFGPVDYVGLYWHLVDLIWIYLFPLLYLIR